MPVPSYDAKSLYCVFRATHLWVKEFDVSDHFNTFDNINLYNITTGDVLIILYTHQ